MMIDARVQLLELLRTIKDDWRGLEVKMQFPKEVKNVPLITFFEISNSSTNIKIRNNISYQIDVWECSFERCVDLMNLVDDKMIKLGMRRDFVSPDSDSVDASGYYRKTLRYSRYVDLRTGRLID